MVNYTANYIFSMFQWSFTEKINDQLTVINGE